MKASPASARILVATDNADDAHVVLMDVRLPGMDGVALTRHLKASPLLRGIPVV